MKIQKYKDYLNKISVFFNTGLANYWNTITSCCVNEKPKMVERYYLDFSSKSKYIGKFDNAGVPLYRLGDSELFYHPIVICQYALGLFEVSFMLNHNNNSLKKNFLTQADWLVNSFKEKNKIPGWYFGFDIEGYKIKSPWISAMAQGEAISVLVRANLLTDKSKYVEVAEKALKPFNISAKQGGFVNMFNGFPVYEEYPSPDKTVAVLNGFIFSLFGLYDLTLYNNNNAKLLFDRGVNTLNNILKFYDLNYWSQYYLFDYPNNYPASFTYHLLVIEQLKALYILTGNKNFFEYSEKWSKQGRSIINKLRVLFFKITYARKLSWSNSDN